VSARFPKAFSEGSESIAMSRVGSISARIMLLDGELGSGAASLLSTPEISSNLRGSEIYFLCLFGRVFCIPFQHVTFKMLYSHQRYLNRLLSTAAGTTCISTGAFLCQAFTKIVD
jgi:hypothetical protein